MDSKDLQQELRELLGDLPQRAIPTQTDEDRAQAAANTGGNPILDVAAHSNAGSTPFIDYLNGDILHTLQQPRSDEPEEMTFISLAHVMEVLFKLLCYEMLRAKDSIARDALDETRVTLRRVHKTLEFLGQTWGVLSTITPHGYLGFRDYLGIGSGFESFMYRRLEFMLGNKQPRMLEPHKHVPSVYQTLKRTLETRSVYDEVIALLHRRGYPIDAQALDRDWSQPYQSNESVKAVWADIYRSLPPHHELYEFAESLVDFGDRFKLWRFRHFVTVERLIGFKPGTGGTAGVGWLRHIVDQNFFPELWEIRSQL
ncbi:tryptophan 2,3-dioxygenase [Caballeronia sordidicola]|uniref:tryptophan 2,3-dioxygenase n=1 Tax=Caballeronia sordidicola TaxID=196367 RepID=UPI0005522FC8|nr:tryptophan 2,3-dioxygenase family protein [Caballeronia sordidicola]